MKVVFAGWVKATGEGEKGVEFEVWTGGIRAIRTAGIDAGDGVLKGNREDNDEENQKT